jgi:6,7-dimethyl-8-ribityllumazine synthase
MQIEQKEINIDAKGLKVGIVTSRFNEAVTNKLEQTALQKLEKLGVLPADTKSYSVPGAIEIPYLLDKLAATKQFDCLVALGAVIRGETPHFDYVCKMASEGTLRVSLDYHIPIGFGVLMLENESQVDERIHVASDAVLAALELAKIKV